MKNRILFILLIIVYSVTEVQSQKTEGISSTGKVFIVGKNTDINKFVKTYVEEKISTWQKKGEYEKTADYQSRVNEQLRSKKIQEYTDDAVVILKKEYSRSINWTNLQLGAFDADNEAYLITSQELGNFALPVSVASAPSLKQNWSSIKILNTDFYVSANKFVLAKIEVFNPMDNKKFVYDSKQVTTYSANNIQYNFGEIKVDVKDDKVVNNTKITETKTTMGRDVVDTDIPVSTFAKNNTYCLIIGNEDYSSNQTGINSEMNVQFAVNDAKIFKEYCVKTFGIPEKNVTLLTNATGSKMLQNIELISKIAKANNGNAELIFYYAGHGLPDEQTKEPYLIPVDVSGNDLKYAVKLMDVYKKLTENPSNKVTVFLDACFSGGARNESLLALRRVKIKAKENVVGNNLVVFTSSSGDESSAPYKEKQHGMFTYYLLKKIQDSKGNCTYKELEEYLKKEISVNSLVINKKQQTPQVIGSPDVEEKWKNWKIK
ncbi:MAG: caspase family protein [Bacteroidetes bacterium]|nr:caspase family protein [Bacteroidota bacterium]